MSSSHRAKVCSASASLLWHLNPNLRTWPGFVSHTGLGSSFRMSLFAKWKFVRESNEHLTRFKKKKKKKQNPPSLGTIQTIYLSPTKQKKKKKNTFQECQNLSAWPDKSQSRLISLCISPSLPVCVCVCCKAGKHLEMTGQSWALYIVTSAKISQLDDLLTVKVPNARPGNVDTSPEMHDIYDFWAVYCERERAEIWALTVGYM